MTAEPDALRLVPTKATRKQLEDAAFNLSAEIGPEEALKLAPHIERAYELLVAAAPAVQPAAGETVARKHSDKCWGRTSFSDEMAHCYCPRPIGWTNQVALDAARDHPKEAAWMWGAPNGSINIPLYAHPPAQGSESGGEVERLRVLLDNLVIAQTLSREIRQSATDEARSYLYQLRQAALSPQPGPASEGDGE